MKLFRFLKIEQAFVPGYSVTALSGRPLIRIFLILVSFLLAAATHAQSTTGIDRAAYYKAIQQGKKELMDKELALLQSAPPEARQAFSGAMIMRKAGTAGSPHQKLKLFRQGHRDLEAAIKKDPGNVEYRFLRLIIQEHAPGILGYRDNLEEDSEIIRDNYQKLPAELRKLVEDYSKKSKILKLQVS
jgi:hypothetical protein